MATVFTCDKCGDPIVNYSEIKNRMMVPGVMHHDLCLTCRGDLNRIGRAWFVEKRAKAGVQSDTLSEDTPYLP